MYNINHINVLNTQDILPAIYMKNNYFYHFFRKILSFHSSFFHHDSFWLPQTMFKPIFAPNRRSVLFMVGCLSFWLFSYSNKGCNYLTIKGRKAGKQNKDFSLENKTRENISRNSYLFISFYLNICISIKVWPKYLLQPCCQVKSWCQWVRYKISLSDEIIKTSKTITFIKARI